MEKRDRKPNYFMIGIMMFGTFIAILNNVALSIALPEIMLDLEIEEYSTVQWLTSVNMLFSGILIPASAYFITRFKSHHVFLTAMSLFTIGAFMAIQAPNFHLLLIARGIQASGTAILMPLLMNVMLSSFSREHRGKAMGVYGLIYMLAPVMGPLLSGLVVDNYGWRMIFIVIAPLSLINLILGIWKLENVLEQQKTTIDYLSLVLSSIGFTSILLGFGNAGVNGWMAGSVLGLISLGFITLLVFAFRQFRIERPLLDLKVYTYPMFALSSIIAICLAMILYAPLILLPFYFQNVQGYTTLQSSLIPLPGTIVMALAMPFTGKLYDKIGAKILAILGFIFIGIASYFMSILTLETTAVYLMFWLIIRSFGISLILMPMQTNGLNQLPAKLHASGTAVNGTIQQVSGAVGMAVFVTLKTHYLSSRITYLTTKTAMEYGSSLTASMQEEIIKQAGVDAFNYTAFVTLGISIIALFFSLFVKKPFYQDNLAEKIITEEIILHSKDHKKKSQLKKA